MEVYIKFKYKNMKIYSRDEVKSLPFKMILFFGVGDNVVLDLDSGAEVWQIICKSSKRKDFKMQITNQTMHIWRIKQTEKKPKL